jgi:hypothetical protein
MENTETKIIIEVNLTNLMGKAKELDPLKLLELYNKLNSGETIKIFNDSITIKKMEKKKK